MTFFNYLLVIKRNLRCHRSMSTIHKIDKLLIANRGEIACRVIRTAKKLGIKTVAVYSDPDQNALHVQMADEAHHIGPAPTHQSYLRSDKILQIAKKTCTDAIHPGYGFLSENVEFAQACEAERVIFVGPPASAIRDMGIKSTSKDIMAAAGVPIIKGYTGKDQSIERLQKEADDIGYPIMIKADRGGGGKGMRIAMSKVDFVEALKSAKVESMKAFGDDQVLLEKFVIEPRHVEVQVFGDHHGNYVHLFERDCSVQRRHQKVIEEAPAPGLTPELRVSLGATAIRAAQAVNYVGAGTVEFIFDKSTNEYNFMEMNTRLQVEHPITEMITGGVDLVEWQLRVASGETLPVTQEQIKLTGHAFEGRIYAEAPYDNFIPTPGQIRYFQVPDFARIETGVRQNDEISVYYDPLIAKLVVWGPNRENALKRFQEGLLGFHVGGIETNINFLLDLSRNQDFRDGLVHTEFIPQHKESLLNCRKPGSKVLIELALAVVLSERNQLVKNQTNPFFSEIGFRVNHKLERSLKFQYMKEMVEVKVRYISGNKFEISTGNDNWVTAEGIIQNNQLRYTHSGETNSCNLSVLEDAVYIFNQDGTWKFDNVVPNFDADNIGAEGSDDSGVVSPMPGILEKISVKAGDVVKKGDLLFVLIAMKMEHAVKATGDYKILRVNHQEGANVSKNDVIVNFEKIN